MEKCKSPKGDPYYSKEKIYIKNNDNENFYFSKSPNVPKNNSNKEILKAQNSKNSQTKNELLNPSNNSADKKSKEKESKNLPQTKNRTEIIIKEKIISNVPNKGKGRSLEKVPLENKNKNNKNNNTNLNKKKDKIKKLMEIGKKNKVQKRNNSAGKNNRNRNKNIRINVNEKIKQNQINKNLKNKNNNLNEYNNTDNMKNININEEKLNQNNYINYNIINNNINSSSNITSNPKENNPFKKYNSVCVSINNNYNYNVSLEKPPNSDNYNFLNHAFIQQNIENKDDIKNKDKEVNWKEKILNINKQKNNVNFFDFKKLNNTDSNFWKKNEKIKFDEKKLTINISESNSEKKDYILKQNNKNNNSSTEENSNKNNLLENSNSNDEKKNEPTKISGILKFLRSFKGMLPFNMRKKNSRNNTDSNNSANVSNNDIKEKLNKSENSNNSRDNNSKDIKKNYNTINAPKTEENNIINNTKNKVYEKRKISFSSKNDEFNNYNYYSDGGAYDSCPIPNKSKNINLYKSSNFHKNNFMEKQENPQILSYSQKNILKNNILYNNDDIHFDGRIESYSNIMKREYNNNKTEEIPHRNDLFSIFDIRDNQLYRKKNSNNIINNFNKKISSPLNDINYNNSAYIKKTKKRILSPIQNSKSENINNEKYDNSYNNEKEIRKFSFNSKNINNYNNNNYNINFNDINIGRENKNRNIERQKLIENNDKDKYNSENIEENLNINAEKKIQEIKININYKKEKDNINYSNTINYGARHPLNDQFMNTNVKKLYSTMDYFPPNPKPKTEIESCIINFDKNKNKQMKIYENNLYNKANTPNNNTNNDNNYNFNLIKNFNKAPLSDNFNSYSYSNIHDINNPNNIYSKPNNKNKNVYLSDKNVRREKNLSFGDLNIDIKNLNLNAPRPIKKKLLINNNEKTYKINKLSDSEEFDNDINSVNSDSSSQNKNSEINRSQMLPNSQNITSIYSKPFKTYLINNNSKSSFSANNSFNNIFNPEIKNDKYNTDFGINYNYNERKLSMTNPSISKSINNINQNANDIIQKNSNNIPLYLNKSNNLNNIDKVNQNYNNLSNSGAIIYTKKSNSTKINNKILEINNKTPIPSNDYNYVNDNKINNIKTIIRPKVVQKKLNFVEKLYNYWMKSAKISTNNYYFSRKNIEIKIYKLPNRQICSYSKYYYKIIQKPIIKNNYIDKKRIKNRGGLKLPCPQKCLITKNNNIININKLFINKNTSPEKINPKVKEEILEENIENDELENNNININNEIKINNKIYSTPTQNLKEFEENQPVSPKFASKSEKNQVKSNQNKIISIEIQLNNQNKCINKDDNDNNLSKNLSSSYNNIQMNTIDSLYVKKKPNINNLLNAKNNKIYFSTENEKNKTYVKQNKRSIDDININNFFLDDTNIYKKYKSNKIISIDIDLSKEQKKLQEQPQGKNIKELKTYKRPNIPTLIEPIKNIKKKIETITINYNQNNNLNNNINNNLNNNVGDNFNNINYDRIKNDIITKLDMINESNLSLIVEEFLDLLTKKIIIDKTNPDNIIYNKVRSSFMEILGNEYIFTEIIINKAIYNQEKISIFGNLCNKLCIRLTNEINLRGNYTEEDLKTILAEESKLKFEEITKNNEYNINDNTLLGILLLICELINYRIVSLDIGYFCFEKLCYKYNNFFYENGSINKYYYLDMIVEFLKKYGKIIYIEKNMKYLERIDNYFNNELNNLVNADAALPEFLRNKIVNLIKIKENQWMF